MILAIHKALEGHPLVVKFPSMVIAFCFYDYMCDHMYNLFQQESLHSCNISCNVNLFGGILLFF
jgi:hypothetical protein